jgi:tRNA nucleotidyltransferase (CCA-adding enzyme)
MKLILTHENADFDAVASMLGASKLYPDAVPILPKTINRAVQEFLLLYNNALPFIQHKDWKLRRNKIEQVILTDTHTYQLVKGIKQHTPTLIIDHHPLERDLKAHETWDGEVIGSASTLLIERIQKQKIAINSLEATLLALGIYADTGMLTYGGTTARDATAVAWLLKQGAVLNTIRRFLTLPLTDTQQTLFDKLLKTATHRTIQGHSVTIASTQADDYIEGISSVTHRLIDIWDSSAIFTLVAMPKKTQLVCRSRVDDIDVSTVAELFGGGGHPKAAAASVNNSDVTALVDQIWQYLQVSIRPAVRVADLMSHGLQYLDANDPLEDKLSFVRRVGHEGYPVVEDNRIVGLLTRRDADRASEHKLKALKIRDVMIEGNVTLTLDDSVSALEQLIVNSNWGQIPVVDDDGKPIGIVTRTDLITYWAMTHPSHPPETPTITPDDMVNILGAPVAQLITIIAQQAQSNNTLIYMVGGAVRDMLLKRKNLDIDFVVEGDAIVFTENLAQVFGGTVYSHKPFGTAKWILEETVAQKLNLSLDNIPHHIDFATARFEYYEQPTALPTVYSSSIKLDLQRRDFTMNTLAIQLSPQQQMWRILDFYGGISDLKEGLIRVLHSLSFVDDPTRILRAVRFSERLHFVIDPRTSQLILGALPMLKRITGERIQNEITLILREDTPERSILKLQALGVLEAIRADFQVSIRINDYFEQCRTRQVPWDTTEQDITRLYWHIMMIGIPSTSIEDICHRFGLGHGLTQSMIATASLLENSEQLTDPSLKPSQITQYLENFPEITLQVAWIAIIEQPLARKAIEQFMNTWRHQRTIINGNHLKQRGLPPGPQYKVILGKLRYGWIDGDITTKDEELDLLHQLTQGNLNNDNP